jgi:hypothetical protein
MKIARRSPSRRTAAAVLTLGAGNGTHSVDATVPVGIEVYGYGQYTSYWYPGGQNLEHF